MIPTKTPVQAEHEARAQIIWGEAPETVVRFLLLHGFNSETAAELVESLIRERAGAVRGIAIRKLAIGGAMISIPVITYLTMVNGFGVVSYKLAGITGAVGLWGALKAVQGTILLLFPDTERGDLADQSD